MYSLNRQRMLASLLALTVAIQSCGVPRGDPNIDGSNGGACTRETPDGGCNAMEFDTNENGDVVVRPGSESSESDSDADPITPHDTDPTPANDTALGPDDEDLEADDDTGADEDDTEEGGDGSGGGGSPTSGGRNAFLDALGEGLANITKGLMEGLGGLFGNAKKKKEEKKRRIMKGIEEAEDLAEQAAAVEEAVREDYTESSETLRLLEDPNSFEQPDLLKESINAAGRDHNEQLDELVRSRPSFVEFSPDDAVCRELGNCNYKNPEQQKVAKAKGYIEGARSVVRSRYSGEEQKAREQMLDIGLDMAEAAEQSYANGDLETADQLLELGLKFADMAIGAIPVVGDILDIASAAAGQNIVTGEELSPEEAIMQSAAALASLASGGVIGSIKDLAKAAKVLKQAAKRQAKKQAKKAGQGALSPEKEAEVSERVEKGRKSVDDGKKYPKDVPGANVENHFPTYNSERDARAHARTQIGKDPVYVGDHKYRSRDGKWQYRAKPNDLEGHGPNPRPHVHLERLDPKTGEVLENHHLQW